MTASLAIKDLSWKRFVFLLFLILVPNYLVMRVQLAGPVDDLIALGTALDLVIILPLAIYFWAFRKRVSWLVLFAFVFWGLLLANWMIPDEVDAYLSYFNYSVIVLEAGIIVLELILFVSILKRLPLLMKNYRQEKTLHFHFLLSFYAAIQNTFSLTNKRGEKFQLLLRFLATDLAAIYYSLFSWKKKVPVLNQGHVFTFHKDGSYLGVFFLLVHAMALEVIAVHLLAAQFSHTLAWILTALDLYVLLFIIADYQAIRLSPVVLDSSGIHFQKGIRQYGFVSWNQVMGVEENTLATKQVEKESKSVQLALHGLEKEQIPYVIKLKEDVDIRSIFGKNKTIDSIYVRMDNVQRFNEVVFSYLNDNK